MNKTSLISAILILILSFASSDPIRVTLYRKKASGSSYLELLPDSKQFIYANISLTNFLNDQYIGKIHIGENKQPFNLLFDTGSAWLWVADKSAGLSKYFDCSSSSTCEKKHHTFELMYGQGHGQGHLTIDQIHFGENFSVMNQHFLTVSRISNMGTLMGDGILGLGFKSLSESYPTFLDTMHDQGIIDNKIFSIYLGNDPTSSGDETGVFMLGGYDPYFMQSNFTFFNVTDTNYWAINFNSTKFGNRNIKITENTKAIIDSGTSLISFPSYLIQEISSHLSSLGITCSVVSGIPIFCDCPNSFDDFPNITLGFDNWFATLTGRDYVTNVGGECMLGFQLVDYLNYVILGDIFMRKYYTIFDADSMKIGFALATPFIPTHFWRTSLLLIGLSICIGLIFMVARHYRRVVFSHRGKKGKLLPSSEKSDIFI